MDCGKVKELASEYVEGTLPTALARAVREHSESCAACAADLEAVRAVWTQLDALPAAEPPLFFHENVMTAIGRAEASRRKTGWRALLPQLGRVAMGTLATGTLVAALAWTLLFPANAPTVEATFPPVGRTLPGSGPTAVTTARLGTVVSTTTLNQSDPAYKFSFWIEGVDRVPVRIQLLSSESLDRVARTDRRTLTERVPQEVLVAFAAVDEGTVNLRVSWFAAGQGYTRYLFVPIPREGAKPSPVQSFGLPESDLATAAREMAARYGVPVTLEGIDAASLGTVRMYPSDETALQAFQRALAGRGVRVSQTRAGILIEPGTP